MQRDDGRYAREQYQSADRLNVRISIHDKYSANRQGFGNWIFEQYEIPPGARILEVGCGTGIMWKGLLDRLPDGVRLVLSDIFEGMLRAARDTLGAHPRVSYEILDIQDLPFEDASFDIVIANMMLYHVPDLDCALGQARRVLKRGGRFYCATYGEHGIVDFVMRLLPELEMEDGLNRAFTLQNGREKLLRHFDEVECRWYPDELRVSEIGDLIDYLYSLGSMAGLREEDRAWISGKLRSHAKDGVLIVPKEYGVFVCA